MFEWMKAKRPVVIHRPEPDPDAAKTERPSRSGKSASLHKYLDDRFAVSVVLTFAEIEDLLGFALPDLARQSDAWWTAPDQNATRSRFADSWILANRSARPNLQARTVLFERGS